MIRKLLLLMILILPVYAENIGSLLLGTSSLGGESEYDPESYDVKYGLSTGFLIPIRFPGLEVHYKVRAARHPARSNRVYNELEYEYISASNVLLVGKSFYPGPLALLPQAGLGLLYEVIHHEWDEGNMYNLLFIDYSLKVNVPSSLASWGLLLNLEHGIAVSHSFHSPVDRFHVSLVYTY